MDFSVQKAIEILERTPGALQYLLAGISAEWILNNEGEDTWSPYDVIGHLYRGERTDWLVRAELILSDNRIRRFKPFDRLAQFGSSSGKTMNQLLDEFIKVRSANITRLRSLPIQERDLLKTGVHPVFGEVTLSQLLSTWVVHDLDHIAQISRVMAKQYMDEVGPWITYLKVLSQ